jgi:hypothetical protein
MQTCSRALSILLSVLLIVEVDGCHKKEVPVTNSAPPQTTYAAPTPDQLYQLVAPIALFPDNLLAQVLAASTFPDQVTAAYQWIQQNSGLQGQQLLQTVNQQPWDASVKGLTQFPDVLKQMATNLSWTSSLGDAYYNVPQSVMNAVQVMRQHAQQAGNLQSNPQQTVSVQNQPPGSAPPAEASSGQPQTTIVQPPPQTIVIQPAQPDVVYVPTYNPTTVYGAPVAAYPGYSTADMVATGLLSFGVGIAVGAAMSGGGCCGWGWNSWGCGWHNSTVVYNHNTYISNSNTFVNRNNYYNRNNINRNINNANFNRANYNANNLNRNANNFNRNNRTNNFGNNGGTPTFNQNRNQPQFRNENASNLAGQRNGLQPNFGQNRNQSQFQNQNRGNLGQQRGGSQPNFNQNRNQPQFQDQNRGNLGQQRAGSQPSFGQQNRAGLSQNQPRANNISQTQRTPQRGYGQQAGSSAGNSAFGNYGSGGNARTNSARGQQSLQGGGGGARPSGGGGARAGGSERGGGGGRAAGGGRGRR